MEAWAAFTWWLFAEHDGHRRCWFGHQDGDVVLVAVRCLDDNAVYVIEAP